MRNDSITEVVGRLSESGTVSDKELESFKINKDESILASCLCFACQDWILKVEELNGINSTDEEKHR